ncbi:MAG: pitrilysin family protein [Candidatus Eisenbacteria bacterium]|nr:pitrilysin family protein [Candidatus Eisenbacteria bacterium]
MTKKCSSHALRICVFSLLLAPFVFPSLSHGQGTLKYTSQVVGKDSKSVLAPFTRAKFENGLTAIVKELHSAPIVTVDVWARVGSVNENDEINGISHFFEHMFFKGTEKRGVGEMDRIVKSLGGRSNAGTSVEYTHYYITVPAQHMNIAVDLLSDALANSKFAPEEIEKERKVVKEEINRKEDDPNGKLFTLFQEALLPGTPWARPVLGTNESLDRIDREAFLKYVDARYGAENLVVVIAGDVSTGKALGEIGRGFSSFRHAKETGYPDIGWSPLTRRVERVIEKDVNRGYLMLGFQTKGRSLMKDFYPLEVAAAILGEGKSSRLYQNLREKKKIVSNISVWSWDLDKAGALGLFAELDPALKDSVEAAIKAEMNLLAEKGITEEELQRAKMMLKSKFAFESETGAGVAGKLGRAETLQGAEEALRYVDGIGGVTSSDVMRVARDYLKGKPYAVCYILPKTKG